MDTILLLSGEEQKFERFLGKLGYDVSLPTNESPLKDIVDSKILDLIILDTAFSTDAVELCDFLRSHESTKQVPIICLLNDKVKGYKIRDLGHEKIEMIPAPYTVGSMVAKIATQLRLRKMAGQNTLSATIAEANASLRDLNARFKREMDQARAIQQSLLPESLPQDGRFEISATYMPLEEVGGDWYFFNRYNDDKQAMLVSDVTGHGLAAAFVGSMTRLALTAANKENPAELLKEANRLMSPQLPQGTFVTMCSVLYDPTNGHISCANAGHPPALVLKRKEKQVLQLKGTGFAVGFFEDSDYTEMEAVLDPDDLLLIYTDGITEAQNRSAEQYGIERFASKLLTLPENLSPQEVQDEILKDFKLFCDGRILKDDITLLVLRRKL